MSAGDLFWRPENGSQVLLKPKAAANWPFAVERNQPFSVSLCDPKLEICWITPFDPKRRWHSSPIPWADLMPAPQPQHGDAHGQ